MMFRSPDKTAVEENQGFGFWSLPNLNQTVCARNPMTVSELKQFHKEERTKILVWLQELILNILFTKGHIVMDTDVS